MSPHNIIQTHGIASIIRNIRRIQTDCGGIFRRILLISLNIAMGLNNVMHFL
jgi:hypothetical protein